MGDDWKLKKWAEQLTPRRAIQNFFANATPVDSPDPDELVQLQDDKHEGTPLASQSSQSGGALKRKIISQQTADKTEENASKKFNQQESGEDSSVLEHSELPSQLASPSAEPLPRPKAVNRKRVSMTPFSQVIQSQESQPSKINETASVDNESFPSNLASPDMIVSQRPAKKSRISTSAFSKTIESQRAVGKSVSKASNAADDSSLDSTDIPLSLESPVIKTRPGPKSSKKRMSSLGLQEALTSQHQSSNVNKSAVSTPEPISTNTTIVPDALDSPVNLTTEVRPLNKQRKRMSTTAFRQIIEQRTVGNLPSKSPLKKVSVTETVSTSSHYNTTKEPGTPSKRASTFIVEKFVVDEPEKRKSGRTRSSRSFTSTQEYAGQDAVEEQRSADIEEMESPQERSLLKQPPVGTQSTNEPPTNVVEETIMKTQTSQAKRTVSPENIEQYLSFSDDEITNQSNAKDLIVEFTAQEIQQHSRKEGRKSEAENPIPEVVIDKPAEIADEDQVIAESPEGLEFTKNQSIVFKRNSARRVDKSTIADTTVNTVALPDIDSPEDFAPTASSTQLVKKKPLPAGDTTVIEELLNENQRGIANRNLSTTSAKSSQSGREDNLSISDIPSKLNSPEEIKRDRLRAGPASTKKRVSTSDFFAVLNQNVLPPPRLETPGKSFGAPQVSLPQPETVPEAPQETKSLQVEPVQPERTPSAASSATERLNAERNSADEADDESQDESDSGSEMVLLPSETNKTSQSVASMRSRKSLIFDSIETTVDSTSVEESPASSTLHPTTPTVEPIETDPSPEKARLAPAANKTLEKTAERSRKSLRFGSPVTTGDVTPIQESAASNIPSVVVNEEIVEETPSGEIEQDADLPEEMPEEESARRASTEEGRLSASSRKSEKSGLSPFNRYPALKNSTVVAGGAPFIDVSPLSMSPIVSSDKESPSVSTTPATPAQTKKKPSRSIAHSPMYLSVMQKAYKKQEARKLSAAMTPITSKPAEKSLRKGASLSNTLKGKSLTLAALSEDQEPSETEDDDAEDHVPVKPISIEVAFRRDIIPDRSKNYVPLEKRLKEDPTFQAKVSVQKAKIEAAKAAEKLAAATARTAQRKTRTKVTKKIADNITSVATNKANLRFYSKFKVAKDALDVVHELVSEWAEFTLDQLEAFGDEEGVYGLDTWQHCAKMLKKQNIVENDAAYAGLCHEVLLNDEAEDLLPSEFPAGHYESKRLAKRRRLI